MTPEAWLKFGELGVLFAVLVFTFGKIAPGMIAALKDNAAAVNGLMRMLAEGEAKAVERHQQTREQIREIVKEELEPLTHEVRQVRELDSKVLEKLPDLFRENRHDTRNAIHSGANATAEYFDLAFAPLYQQMLRVPYRRSPLPFPAVRPRNDTPDPSEKK